jgi:hypothetical protein
VIPALRAHRTSTGTRKPGSKTAVFYRVLANGEERPQSDSQNTWSSFVYYHSAKFGSAGERMSTDAATAYVKTLGVDSPMGKPWEIEVNGVKYGMRTVGADDTEKSEEE